MPVRALRLNSSLRLSSLLKPISSETKNARQGIKTAITLDRAIGNNIESETKNARQGIKTFFTLSQCSNNGVSSETKNARQGIKTLQHGNGDLEVVLVLSETKNARQGIKTFAHQISKSINPNIRQKQKMPVRALRLLPGSLSTMVTRMGQKQKMPVRALRRHNSSIPQNL